MRSRILVGFVVVTFVFTFAFAFAAGAQETPGAGATATQNEASEDETSLQSLEFAEGEQAAQAERRETVLSGPLKGTRVGTRSTDEDIYVEVITIPGRTCVAKKGASFVLQDEDGTQADFKDRTTSPSNGGNVRITEVRGGLKVVGKINNKEADIVPINERGSDAVLDTGGLKIVTSTGIRCEGGGSNDDTSNRPSDGDGVDNGTNDDDADNNGSNSNGADDEGGLASDRQYSSDDGDTTDTEEDVIVETISEKALPNTGGVSLFGLVVLGLFSLSAGLMLLGSTTRRGT